MSSKLVQAAIHIMVMAIVIAVILIFLAVGMLAAIHVCILGRAFRRLGNPERSNNSRNRNVLSQDDLQKLPCYDYMARDRGSSSPVEVDCAVCLESFKMGEKCRLLPLCKHSFHAECVDSWLLRNPICPICRTTADSEKHQIGESSENVVEAPESPLGDVRIVVRGNEIREEEESRENQTNFVGNHV